MRPSSAIAAVIALTLWQACTPRCQSNCAKVLDCGLGSTRVARSECVQACQLEQALYAEWEDETKIEAFKEHKRCIRAASCDELADGVCYDPELFIFEPTSENPVDEG